MKTLFSRFIKDESGATAIEYGLIAALIAVVLIVSLNLVSSSLSNTFTSVSQKLDAANTLGNAAAIGGAK